MSWEAVTWANRQKLKKSYEQHILLVLANCADPNGEAFVKWPGRDHWWQYLSEKTRLPKSSLFRHLATLVALGLGSKSTIVLADGTKRPTFKLHLHASFDIETDEGQARYDSIFGKYDGDESQSPIETGEDGEGERDQSDSDINDVEAPNPEQKFQSPVETGISSAQSPRETEPFPVLGMHKKDSLLRSKDSPLPPSGGASAVDEDWEDFVRSWGEPIPKLRLAREAWDRVETAKRTEAIAAAKGYRVWLKAHPKPPTEVSAQGFLRDQAGFTQWLRYAPGATPSTAPTLPTFAMSSREGQAINMLYRAAGCVSMDGRRSVSYPNELTPQLLKFADAPERSAWPFIEDREQMGAWFKFFRAHVFGNRRDITRTKGIGRDLCKGIEVPWDWPPRKDGTTGPPESLMTEDDFDNFK